MLTANMILCVSPRYRQKVLLGVSMFFGAFITLGSGETDAGRGWLDQIDGVVSKAGQTGHAVRSQAVVRSGLTSRLRGGRSRLVAVLGEKVGGWSW